VRSKFVRKRCHNFVHADRPNWRIELRRPGFGHHVVCLRACCTREDRQLEKVADLPQKEGQVVVLYRRYSFGVK